MSFGQHQMANNNRGMAIHIAKSVVQYTVSFFQGCANEVYFLRATKRFGAF